MLLQVVIRKNCCDVKLAYRVGTKRRKIKSTEGRLFSHSIKRNLCYENTGSSLKVIRNHNCKEEKTGLEHVAKYSSEISPKRCNNCVFILQSGFTLHVSGDNLTHHQEYICCIWPQVSRLT